MLTRRGLLKFLACLALVRLPDLELGVTESSEIAKMEWWIGGQGWSSFEDLSGNGNDLKPIFHHVWDPPIHFNGQVFKKVWLYDRVLTDEEIAEVSAEMCGL